VQESTRQEQPSATRQVVPILSEALTHLSDPERHDPTTALPPSLGQLEASLGQQIQTMAFQTATAAFAKERERLMDEFRTKLQNEATAAMECVVSNSKEELMRHVLKEFRAAQDIADRITYEHWNKKMEQVTKNTVQSMVAQALEITRRVEGMTVSTLERLQRNMEASRIDAIDRFLARLREQLDPLLEDSQVTLQALKASEIKLRDESQAIHERFDNLLQQAIQNSIAEAQERTVGMLDQFESDVTKRVVESHDRLNERSVEVIGGIIRILQKLSQGCEETVQGQLRSLVSCAAADVTKLLKEETADIVRQLSNQRDGNTRRYSELTSESVAQIPKKAATQAGG